jgi:arginine repressor
MQRTDDDLSRFLVSRLEQAGTKVTQPTVSLMSPRFQWVPSYSTDLRESFRRIKEAQEAAA